MTNGPLDKEQDKRRIFIHKFFTNYCGSYVSDYSLGNIKIYHKRKRHRYQNDKTKKDRCVGG